MDKEYLSTQEVLTYLSIARSTLYKYISEGKLTVYKAKAGTKKSYFKKQEIEALSGFLPREDLPKKDYRQPTLVSQLAG